VPMSIAMVTRTTLRIVDGRTLGGAAQGIDTAICEESSYAANSQIVASPRRMLAAIKRGDPRPGRGGVS
jgi:hypothetical protein